MKTYLTNVGLVETIVVEMTLADSTIWQFQAAAAKTAIHHC